MARDINQVIITGRLGADPEIRNTGAGKPVASFRVASSESWTKDGEKKEKTEWINVTVFREATARFVEHYVKKGDKVLVRGKFSTRMYEKDGVKHYPSEVVITDFDGDVLAFGSGGEGGRSRPDSPDDYGTTKSSPSSRPSSGAPAGGTNSGMDNDDSIPF